MLLSFTLMYQTKLSHMFNCVITGSTRLSKQRKFRIYVLDNFFGNCYYGSFFARYGNCCFGQLFVKSLLQTNFEYCCCGTLFHPNFANHCCGSLLFTTFLNFFFVTVKQFFVNFANFVVVDHFRKFCILTLRCFNWSGGPGCHGRSGGPGGPGNPSGPGGHGQDGQGW